MGKNQVQISKDAIKDLDEVKAGDKVFVLRNDELIYYGVVRE